MLPDSTSASTATAELDDLMTSLNNFKMDDRNVDEPVIGGAPNLDDMLGNLQVCVFLFLFLLLIIKGEHIL